MQTNYKNLYDILLETDELYLMFPNFKGIWEKDMNNFIEYQNKLELEVLKLEVKENEDYDNIR